MPPIHAPADATRDSDTLSTETRRKRALFRAWHRGTREMDLVMGRFAAREMEALSPADLAAFERLLDEPEPEVSDWVMQRAPAPPAYDLLIDRIRVYSP